MDEEPESAPPSDPNPNPSPSQTTPPAAENPLSVPPLGDLPLSPPLAGDAVMEDSESTIPDLPDDDDDESPTPLEDEAAAAAAPPLDDEAATPEPSRKRRRRKKLFPEMIPSSHALRALRSSRSAAALLSSSLDPIRRRRRRRLSPPSRLSRDLSVESLIAAAAGFPLDILSDDEILSAVVPLLSSPLQSTYLVIRNHILSLFRQNPNLYLSEPLSAASILPDHRHLVSVAHQFLQDHAFINFGILQNPPPPQIPPTQSTIIIIGAGLAGLAAARHLQTLGFNVAIVEGRRRPGGRVLTYKMSGKTNSGSEVIAAADLGGSVLTGINGNPLGVIARQLGFPLHKVRDKCPLYLPDGRPVDPEVDSRVEVAFNQLLDKVCKLRGAVMEEFKSVDMSLGTALEAFRKVYGVAEPAEERMLLNWHLANLEYANAALLSDLSMAFWDQDDPYEMGGDHCFIPGGNCRFVRALAENVPIFYDRTVRRIQYGSDGVMVYAGGQVFRGDMALCTVPLGVLKKGSIEFVPELPPQKQEAIERLGFGLLNKVAMLFPYDFWGGDIDTFGHLSGDWSQRGEFFLFYSYCSVSGGPLLVALVAGESAIKFEQCSPNEPVERVLDVLRGIFAPKGIEVPKPLQVICTRWGSDKFTYGSYSYVGIGSSGDDYDVLAETIGDGKVFFAGEATNRRYPATMHGALLSGYREAANMLRAAKRRATAPVVEKMEVKEEVLNLDVLFQTPDLSFGSFSVLYDPGSGDPDSTALVRVGVGESKSGLGSLFLYGLISRKHVMELSEMDGDENRLSLLYRSFGAKLVGRNGLGSLGETLICRIKSASAGRDNSKTGTMDGTHAQAVINSASAIQSISQATDA